MDISDSSNLIKTFKLDESLISLLYKKDKNDSQHNISDATTCGVIDEDFECNTLFGETIMQSAAFEYSLFNNKEPILKLQQNQPAPKIPQNLTSENSLINTDLIEQKVKICFFNKDIIEININPSENAEKVLKKSIEIYSSTKFKLKHGVFTELYEFYIESEKRTLESIELVWKYSIELLHVRRNSKNIVNLCVFYNKTSITVEIEIDKNLQDLIKIINKQHFFPFSINETDFLLVSKISEGPRADECQLNIDTKIQDLPNENLILQEKVYADEFPAKETSQSDAYPIKIILNCDIILNRKLCINERSVEILYVKEKSRGTLFKKVKMFLKNKYKKFLIPAHKLLGVRMTEGSNKFSLSYLEKKPKTLNCEALSFDHSKQIFKKISELITFIKH